jgi:hypothetical protein
MGDSTKRDIEELENNVNEIRKLIDEVKIKFNSINWTDESLRNAYERTILFQERQLELSIKSNKMISELHRAGE